MSPPQKTGQKQKRLGEKVIYRVGVLQKKKKRVKERLRETRDSNARDTETKGETRERERQDLKKKIKFFKPKKF